MRKIALLAVIPFAFGCAQQSTLRAPSLPTDEPLQVRLFQPSAGALNYRLSEPAYVAIFAVTRGHGISMIFPHYESQADHRSHAGLNQETVHGGSGAWGYSATARNEHRALFGHADAYYMIASKHPLPVDGMLQSPWVLRSLMGADVFRATNLTDTWAALESILVEGMPADAWSADVYLNWRDPFLTASWNPMQPMDYCGGGRGFYAPSLVWASQCDIRRPLIGTTPVPVPVAEGPRRPPVDPLDRNPQVPWNPPRVGPEDAVARTSRVVSRTPSEAAPRREPEPRRSEPSRSEPVRAAESRPQQPAPAEARRPEPEPDPE